MSYHEDFSTTHYRTREQRGRWKINYERIKLPTAQEVAPDTVLMQCHSSDPVIRLAARKKVWRRLRSGFYDHDKHLPKWRLEGKWWLDAAPGARPKCGARTRKGHSCRNRVTISPLTGNPAKRCKFHGGRSTGPRTPDGKAAALAALARGRQARNFGRTSGQGVPPIS